jgi:branched-subunit amino acid aminotransferase/4-amino-4-deoxychorismate lyase
MLDSIAYQNGQWKLFDGLRWSPTDTGPAVGAIAVERLRTFGGRIHALGLHLDRLYHSARTLRCDQDFCKQTWTQVASELIQRNHTLLAQDHDVSMVLLISPGDRNASYTGPTTMAYLESLPKKTLATRYAHGVPLVLSTVGNIPTSCWPTTIKVRSRLQYYLADIEANDVRTGSLALLLDQQNNVTETSIACAIFCIAETWVCPPAQSILPSVTMQFYAEDLKEVLDLQSRPIAMKELTSASEILLLGTTSQLYAASSLDLTLHGQENMSLDGINGTGYSQLRKAMIDRLGFDFTNAKHVS